MDYLPTEIIERILRYCDGKTLLNARKADDKFKEVVDYLTQKTEIWKCCCKEDIPKNQLIDYLQCYNEDCYDKWLNIYINWSSWENPKQVVCDIILSPVEVPKISCMAVSRHFIAVGSQDGRVRIFTSNWKIVFAARLLAVRINSLTFIESEHDAKGIDMCLAISFNNGLNIFCFDGLYSNQLEVHDVKSHSVYKNFICYEKIGGRITIAKLISIEGGRRELTEIWFSRIYSPSCLSCMKMWDGVCTFLINNEVKIVEYGMIEGSTMDSMKKKTKISYNFPLGDTPVTQILRNDVIVSLSKFEDFINCNLIEFFILGENDKCSKKVFSVWEIFKCFITCIYVYGNTLILGTDVGTLYIYSVSSWKNLDLRKFCHKLLIGKHPITSMDVKEMQNERRIYVSTRINIHEVSGFLPNVY